MTLALLMTAMYSTVRFQSASTHNCMTQLPTKAQLSHRPSGLFFAMFRIAHTTHGIHTWWGTTVLLCSSSRYQNRTWNLHNLLNRPIHRGVEPVVVLGAQPEHEQGPACKE